MDKNMYGDELILQSEVVTFHTGLKARIQIMEKSFRLTLYLDTDAYSYPDGILSMAKTGISVKSKLKHQPSKKICKTVIFESKLENPEDFKNIVLQKKDKHYEVEVTLRLYDIARSDVKEFMKSYFERLEDDLK